jgi:predicted CopG family antitoxin
MDRKTISIDVDVYRVIRRKQSPKESLSAALRRLLADEKDPADYMEELFSAPPVVDTALLRRRRVNSPRSTRRRRAA